MPRYGPFCLMAFHMAPRTFLLSLVPHCLAADKQDPGVCCSLSSNVVIAWPRNPLRRSPKLPHSSLILYSLCRLCSVLSPECTDHSLCLRVTLREQSVHMSFRYDMSLGAFLFSHRDRTRMSSLDKRPFLTFWPSSACASDDSGATRVPQLM